MSNGLSIGMSIGMSKEHELYRQHVRMLLDDEPVRAAIARVHAGCPAPGIAAEPDVRPLYRELGRRGLLAPGWPVEYGGEGRGLMEAAIAAEEMVRAGVPDSLHVVAIQIVGLFVLMTGTPEQKAAYLPPLARGERFACVLLTEPGSGSDLGSLTTTARPDGDGGWRVSGVKAFNIKSHLADVALCAVRTGPADSRYQGISVLLVDLHAAGVRRSVIQSIADEQFHRIELDDVRVPAGALLGVENKGWSLLHELLAVERTGLDYSLKAEEWLTAACEVLAVGGDGADLGGADAAGADVDAAIAEDVGRFGAAVAAGRLLSWQVLDGLAQQRPNELAAATAKLYNSELAQRIALWAAARLPGSTGRRGLPARVAQMLESAYREAPGMTLAGGTSEVMLQIIAGLALDGLDEEKSSSAHPDPLRQSLEAALRSQLHEVELAAAGCAPGSWPAIQALTEPTQAALRGLDALALDAPPSAGGMGLGLAVSTAVAEALGRAALPERYLAAAFAIDAAVAGGAPETLVRQLLADEVPVSVAGFDDGTGAVHAAPDGPGYLALTGVLSLDFGTGRVLLPVEPDRDRVAVTLLDLSTVDIVPVREPSGATGRVTLAGTRCPRSAVLGEWPVGALPEGPLGRARIRQAAYLLGLARGALATGARYTTDRRQFDRPLRAFQTVAFRLAAAYVQVEALGLAVAGASVLADSEQPYGRQAAEVLAQAAETATATVGTVLQLCGARGMTAEVDVHRHYLRVRREARRLATAGTLWRELGRERLRAARAGRDR